MSMNDKQSTDDIKEVCEVECSAEQMICDTAYLETIKKTNLDLYRKLYTRLLKNGSINIVKKSGSPKLSPEEKKLNRNNSVAKYNNTRKQMNKLNIEAVINLTKNIKLDSTFI